MDSQVMKIEVDLGDFHSRVKSEVFEFVKRELPPNFILQAEQGILVAHKVVLSAASKHFKDIFTKNEGLVKIFIPNVKLPDLSALINLIYNGTVEIQPQQLAGFKNVAEMLQIPLPKITMLPMAEPENVLRTHPPQQELLQEAVYDEKNLEGSQKKSFQELQVETTAPEKVQKVQDIENEKASIEKVENVKEGEPEQKKEETKDNPVKENTPLPSLKKSKRKRKENFKVSEVMATSPSRTRAPYDRRLTGKRVKSSEPSEEQFRCSHCLKIYAKTSKRHITECSLNPDRVVAHCPTCQVEVKPSGLSAHKKWHHGSR